LSKHDKANIFGILHKKLWRARVTTQVCSPIFQKYYGTCTKTFALFDRNCQQQDGNNSKAGKVSGVGRREVIADLVEPNLIAVDIPIS
jgi:hypothetical protein